MLNFLEENEFVGIELSANFTKERSLIVNGHFNDSERLIELLEKENISVTHNINLTKFYLKR